MTNNKCCFQLCELTLDLYCKSVRQSLEQAIDPQDSALFKSFYRVDGLLLSTKERLQKKIQLTFNPEMYMMVQTRAAQPSFSEVTSKFEQHIAAIQIEANEKMEQARDKIAQIASSQNRLPSRPNRVFLQNHGDNNSVTSNPKNSWTYTGTCLKNFKNTSDALWYKSQTTLQRDGFGEVESPKTGDYCMSYWRKNLKHGLSFGKFGNIQTTCLFDNDRIVEYVERVDLDKGQVCQGPIENQKLEGNGLFKKNKYADQFQQVSFKNGTIDKFM